jgi:hypothetical protein
VPLHRQREPSVSRANNGRLLNYAEVSAVYAGVVAGRQLSGVKAGIDSSSTLPTKNADPGECKGVRDLKCPAELPPRPSRPEGRRTSR